MATARRPLDVAVVGGGIGGLAAALALVRSGLNAHVYEQAENWVGVGAGVTLGPNALRLLDRLGLAQRLEAIAAFPSGYAMRRGRDGKVIFRTDGSGPGRKTRSLTFHRAQLLKVLEQALPAERIHLDRRCISVEDEHGRPRVTFQDGSTVEADVVVGADGIHSVVRSTYYEDAPVFSGTIAYRGLVPMGRLGALRDAGTHFRFWLAPRQHFLTFPIARGSLMNML